MAAKTMIMQTAIILEEVFCCFIFSPNFEVCGKGITAGPDRSALPEGGGWPTFRGLWGILRSVGWITFGGEWFKRLALYSPFY